MAKRFILVLAALLGTAPVAFAETQAAANSRVIGILQKEAGISSADVVYLVKQLKSSALYATAAELLAASADDGVFGYAQDTDVLYIRANGAWVSFTSLAPLTLANGATITNSVDGTVVLTEGGESWSIVITNNLFTFTSTTGATFAFTPAVGFTGLITATGGITTTKPLFDHDVLRFCGNGSNAATAWYDGPVLIDDINNAGTAVSTSIGSAFCDANDSATEATADRPFDAYTTIKVVGMACVTQAGGAADTNTFQLRSATADVAGVTCAVTNDGSLPKTCSVVLTAPVTITAGATLAVKNTQSGTDDMSAKDMGCRVYYSY